MGQKTHPHGFRLGFTKTWNAKWYANKKNYRELLKEDVAIRAAFRSRLRAAAIARIIGMGVGGVKPQVMGLGPIPATRKALRHAGITADQIDRVEFNEAFAAQCCRRARSWVSRSTG